jgi:osmotically-inducible protein OsmY
MRPLPRTLLVILLAAGLLQGCAAVLVGGAATGAAMAHDRRTPGAVLDDQRIEVEALDIKYKHADIAENSSISVTSYNGRVLLTGTAGSAQTSRRYADLVREIQGVSEVLNEVQTGESRKFSDATEDGYITSKVKLALFGVRLKGFDPTRVKVVTAGKTVYLMGLLTPEEAEAAVEKVRYVGGVERVVKLFEYV